MYMWYTYVLSVWSVLTGRRRADTLLVTAQGRAWSLWSTDLQGETQVASVLSLSVAAPPKPQGTPVPQHSCNPGVAPHPPP